MEVVYFVISVIELILTAYLVVILNRTTNMCNLGLKNFEEKFNIFLPEFRKYAKILKLTAKISTAYKTFNKKTKRFRKIIKTIKLLKSTLFIYDLIRGKKTKKGKHKAVSLAMKLLFGI